MSPNKSRPRSTTVQASKFHRKGKIFKGFTDSKKGNRNGVKCLRLKRASCKKKSKKRALDHQHTLKSGESLPKLNRLRSQTTAGNKASTGPAGLLYVGSHETQVCPRGEAHLHKHFSSCIKNPGHKQFIPIDKFSLTHLPKRYRHRYLYKVIRLLADLTVRLAVTWTSTERPEFYPESDSPYPFSEIRGSDVMKLGTGRVQEILIYTEKENKLCPCCRLDPHRKSCKIWGELEVVTATHVVFDDSEARRTSCRLFFDNQSSPNLTLQGVRVLGADLEKDLCWLVLSTCDVGLLNKLQKLKNRFQYWWSMVYDVYWDSRDEARLAVIVSHPHGCPKHVSVGRWTARREIGDYDYKYTYTTGTCQGSSGACVYLLGIDGWLYYEHIHSGTLSKHKNFSGAGRDYFRYVENLNEK